MSPLGGVMMWLLLGIVAIGLALSAGTGGMIVWAVMWIVIISLLFIILKNIGRWIT